MSDYDIVSLIDQALATYDEENAAEAELELLSRRKKELERNSDAAYDRRQKLLEQLAAVTKADAVYIAGGAAYRVCGGVEKLQAVTLTPGGAG